jgi:hypothetical protein
VTAQLRRGGSVRTEVTPKDTEVYVDGDYAGPGADSTFKLKATMERLAAGETAAPVPAPARQPRPVAR